MTENSIPRISGIYVITCTLTNKIYVGSSLNLHTRWYRHRYNLRTERHPNRHLQNAWRMYGEDAFTFEVIEIVKPDTLIKREQFWLDELSPFGEVGFNGNRRAYKSPTWGVGHTPEARAKISEAGKKNKGVKKTPEHSLAISNALKGHKISPETKAKISAGNKGKMKGRKQSPEFIRQRIEGNKGNKKSYILISPNGDEFKVLGLTGFCRDHGLHLNSMIKVARGKFKQHKGWRCAYAE